MFIKQKQVRRSSKFTSRWSRASHQRREYVATLYTTGVVQLLLVVFTLIGAFRAWQLMSTRFPDLAWYFKLALPAVLVLVAALIARALIGNIQRAREAYRPPETHDKP